MNKKFFKECIIFATFFFVLFVLVLIDKPMPCMFHKLTNLYCPGCGVTRMVIALLKLNFVEAFCYNQILFCLLVLAIIYNFYKIIYFLLKKRWIHLPDFIFYVIIFVLIIYGILRNIPEFYFLAP